MTHPQSRAERRKMKEKHHVKAADRSPIRKERNNLEDQDSAEELWTYIKHKDEYGLDQRSH